MNHDNQENHAPVDYSTRQPDYIPRLNSRPPLIPMISKSELTTFNFGNLSLQTNTSVTIVFDCGRMSMSISKDKLRNASPFFSHVLQDPQRSHIRLRNDFPFAIHSMLDYLTTGTYLPVREMQTRYPLVTLLDLHIHVYTTAIKYTVPSLANHALGSFLAIAAATMHTDFITDNPAAYTRIFDREHGTRISVYEDVTASPSAHAVTAPPDPTDYSPAAKIARLLNAICLLYRLTGPGDALRMRVVELLKTGLGKLMRLRFFACMLCELELGTELVTSLEGDGFWVGVEATNWVGGMALGVKFWIVREGEGA